MEIQYKSEHNTSKVVFEWLLMTNLRREIWLIKMNMFLVSDVKTTTSPTTKLKPSTLDLDKRSELKNWSIGEGLSMFLSRFQI